MAYRMRRGLCAGAMPGKRTVVVGSGHSAANALLDLAALAEREPGTGVVWAVRGTDLQRAFGGGDADALAGRGALGTALRELQERGAVEVVTGFRVGRVDAAGGKLVIGSGDGRRIEGVDEIVVATGQRPDLAPLRELRLKLDPWLECTSALGPLIDPNLHSCGTVRPHGVRELSHEEPGFYTVGMKSYGRAPTFLMATGYEQVRSIAAFLAGDVEAAYDVRLDLPETGVCSGNIGAAARCRGRWVLRRPRPGDGRGLLRQGRRCEGGGRDRLRVFVRVRSGTEKIRMPAVPTLRCSMVNSPRAILASTGASSRPMP